jgi:hypothetical protein
MCVFVCVCVCVCGRDEYNRSARLMIDSCNRTTVAAPYQNPPEVCVDVLVCVREGEGPRDSISLSFSLSCSMTPIAVHYPNAP